MYILFWNQRKICTTEASFNSREDDSGFVSLTDTPENQLKGGFIWAHGFGNPVHYGGEATAEQKSSHCDK